MARFYLGKHEFRHKKDAIEKVRAIKDKYSPGQTLSAEDFEFVLCVLHLHPEAEEKVGCGVVSIQVESNGSSDRTGYGFWVTRQDGTRQDFSYRKCLTPATDRAKVLQALRTEIVAQKLALVQQAFQGSFVCVCPVTGKKFTVDNAEVDHEDPQFKTLVETFCRIHALTLEAIPLKSRVVGDFSQLLQDRTLAWEWQEFHREHARMRVLSVEGHRMVTHSKKEEV
jgi:hypothetical protein